MQDIKLTYDNTLQAHDISFGADGDFDMCDCFDTAMDMSAYGEERASQDEVEQSSLRRGDWSNILNDVENYEVGGKQWTKYQARNTQDTQNDLEDYYKLAFQWFIDDVLAKDVIVTSERSQRGTIVTISLVRFDDTIESKSFNTWENTGVA